MIRKKPIDPLRDTPGRREPYEAGPWCARCKYYAKINIGHCCNYFVMTGKLRPDGEPTKKCTVRLVPQRPKPKGGIRHVGADLNGAAGPEWLTFRDVALVVRKATSTISNWGTKAGLDRHIEGYHGVQMTVDEAYRMLQGHRLLSGLEGPEGMSPAQLELRALLEAEGREISDG